LTVRSGGQSSFFSVPRSAPASRAQRPRAATCACEPRPRAVNRARVPRTAFTSYVSRAANYIRELRFVFVGCTMYPPRCESQAV